MSGGKGTVRRKIVRKAKPAAQDDKKLQAALKKLNVQPIPGVEEVNMFREDGNVLHFTAPKGASISFLDLYFHNSLLTQKLQSFLHILYLSHCILVFDVRQTVHASTGSNTFAVYGVGHVKELTELVPGILNQLGPDSLASLRKLAESYQAIQQQARPGGAGPEADDDDEDVPDLVENFDEAAEEKKEESAEAEEKTEEKAADDLN
jgi:nascent polypeptide-associated complex subunit beta